MFFSEQLSWSQWYERHRYFCYALILSLLFHLAFLMLHESKGPTAPRHYRSLEAVLVNQSSERAPTVSQVQAQFNLEGGGRPEETHAVKTFLPVMNAPRQGDHLHDRHARLTPSTHPHILSSTKVAGDVSNYASPALNFATKGTGQEVQEEKAIIASLRGQIARLIEERNHARRRLPIGLNARRVSHAYYTNAIATRIEEYGSRHFPEAAKGRSFKVMVTISIRSDGTLEKIFLEKSSGHPILDQMAMHLIQHVFPFRPFPPDISRDYDAIDMTRTIHFWSADDLHMHTAG